MTTIKWNEGESTILINDKCIDLPAPIQMAITMGERVIVLVWGNTLGSHYSANIFAFSSSGEKLWQVEPIELNSSRQFVWIKVAPSGRLLAHEIDAGELEYYIDANSGALIRGPIDDADSDYPPRQLTEKK